MYVGDYGYPGIRKLHPTSNSTPVTNANYVETSIKTQGLNPCQVAVGLDGHAYASQWNQGPLRQYRHRAFDASPPRR